MTASNDNGGKAEVIRSESLSPGRRWTVDTSRSSLDTRAWHGPCFDLLSRCPEPGTCFSLEHQGNRQRLAPHGPCHRPRQLEVLSSMKQPVAFVAGQGMPGTCPEHLEVAQESPGWPGLFEVQGRESVVAHSLQEHFGAGKEFHQIPSAQGGILCLLQWNRLAVSPLSAPGWQAACFSTHHSQP